MSPRLRKALNVAGGIITVVAIAAIALRLREAFVSGELSTLTREDLCILAVLGVLYGICNVALCEAFHQLLNARGVRLARLVSYRVFGLSQIGKYVPGNIFHLLGRQALGGNAGVRQSTLARVSVFELASLAIAAGSFGILVVDSLPYAPDIFRAIPIGAKAVAFVVALTCIGATIMRIFGSATAIAFALYLAFFAGTGLIFSVLVLHLDAGISGATAFTQIIGAYVVSWLIGFVTPGAPAGIGVRDYALLVLLGTVSYGGVILLAVVLSRLVNIIGDVLTFLVSLRLKFAHA